MRMRSVTPLILAIAFGVIPSTVFGDTARIVTLRIEPPQAMSAIVLRSGQQVLAVPVTNGKAIVPGDLALPWSLGLTTFEPASYTQADLDAGRPLVVRELGRLRGTVRRPARTRGEQSTWLLQGGMSP